MLLRERGRLELDDAIGAFIPGLHDDVAQATLAQVMSHSAGLTRDGAAGNQFTGFRPFLDQAELLSDLAKPPILDRNTRFKYRNFTASALLGLVIEAVTNEPYAAWIRREVVAPFGLTETEPDMPLPPGAPLAQGHTGKALLGRSQPVPGDYPLNALTPAAGFVSTAADLARFFALLSPNAAASPLTPDSRREMTRGQWKNPDAALATTYGLGTSSGALGDWNWFAILAGCSAVSHAPPSSRNRNLAHLRANQRLERLRLVLARRHPPCCPRSPERVNPTEAVLGWTWPLVECLGCSRSAASRQPRPYRCPGFPQSRDGRRRNRGYRPQ